MKYLLTGASGFLGSYLLKELNDSVTLGRSSDNDITCDLSVEIPVIPEVDMVIHAAGHAHIVPKSETESSQFFKVNLEGTKNLLLGISNSTTLPKTFVFISTVAVYGLESGIDISESTIPKANTPYAVSKLKAEEEVQLWASKNQVDLVILRLPLIAGGANTPGNLGAMIKFIKKGYYFRVGKGEARKSMVLASDLASLIPSLIGKNGIFNLTDGYHPSIKELDQYLAKEFGKTVKALPMFFLNVLAKIGDSLSFFPINSYRLEKLNQSLTFNDQQARETLHWNPSHVIGNLDLD